MATGGQSGRPKFLDGGSDSAQRHSPLDANVNTGNYAEREMFFEWKGAGSRLIFKPTACAVWLGRVMALNATFYRDSRSPRGAAMRRVSRSQIAMLAVIGTGVVLLFPSLLAGFSQGQSAVETQIELTKIAVEVVKVIGLGAGAYFALYKWRRDERWKRRSMVSDRIKAFRDTPGAYNAQLMLQGRRVKVPLWDRTVSEDPYTMVHPDEVAAALMAVTPGHTWRYSDRHDAIRNSFNDYLGRLADIAMDLSHTSLLNEADVRLLRDRTRRTFLQLCDTNPNTAKALWEYMESGGYQDVAAFIDPPEPSTLQYIKGYLSRSTPEPSGEIKRRYTENLQKPPRNEPTALPGERKGNAEQP